jgi:AraC-like DNA-binding protein
MEVLPYAGSIPGIRYHNRDRPDMQIEVLSLSDLISRVPPHHFDYPQRPEFHLLILALEGSGRHWIDFVRYDWVPYTIFHVRPGQVQQFALQRDMEAKIILFTPVFLASEKGASERNACASLMWRIRPATVLRPQRRSEWRAIEDFYLLAEEYREADDTALSERLLQLQLQTLIVRLVHIADRAEAVLAVPDGAHRTYLRFIEALEQRYAHTRRVEDYATALGYTTRTLTRACSVASQMTPKKLIENRVALEAKRLLVHTDLSIKAIAQEVGFGEDTNFVKFFRRIEGVLPSAFRARYRLR